jgi:sRNA-binding carbon storage regulator CsrA
MLVFTRKPNESFVIQVGAGITITVVSVTGKSGSESTRISRFLSIGLR